MGTFDSSEESFDEFEWDEEKRLANIRKHGIDFRRAVWIFDGPVVTVRSERTGETRWVATGVYETRVISVVYTKRNEVRRVISARPARRKERTAYRSLYPRGA